MFVLFHAGLDIGLPPPYGGCPDMIREVADKFPKLKIVAAHFGGYKMWDEVLEYLAGVENVWLDTALCAGGMQDHEFFSLYHKHGYEKIMMATDWPWRSAMHTIQWLEQKELKQSELEGILGKNACKLLKLK